MPMSNMQIGATIVGWFVRSVIYPEVSYTIMISIYIKY